MANITRIKAKDPFDPKEKKKAPKKKEEPKKVEKSTKSDKKAQKLEKAKLKTEKKTDKKHFILFRPFCAFGRYLRDSWQEIRQVRWPNRKSTWGMVLAIFIYAAIFLALITLLDALFTFVFNIILA